MYTKRKKVEIFITFLLIVIGVAFLSFIISEKELAKLYNADLENIPWMIPIQYMIPLWTIFYLLMGISGALIWIQNITPIRNFAMWAWIIQLLLNFLWPISLFHLPFPIITPILITLLFLTLLILMFSGYLTSRLATLLFIPFFLMITYKLLLEWVFFILEIRLPTST